jgi:LuxR family maltose regulon positive regulatory protein
MLAQLYVEALAYPLLQRECYYWQANLALRGGDEHLVSQWLSWIELQPEPFRFCEREQEVFLQIHIQIRRGAVDQALTRLHSLLEAAQENQRTGSIWHIQLLLALAHVAQGEEEAARSLVLDVLAQTQREDMQRYFLDLGPEMAQLLRTLLPDIKQPALRTYVRAILLGFSSHPEQSYMPNDVLVEPLSHQEQQVLRLLVNDASNADIASSLVISPNTVKTHIRNLYRKLSVSSRKEARAAAKNLSLF